MTAIEAMSDIYRTLPEEAAASTVLEARSHGIVFRTV